MQVGGEVTFEDIRTQDMCTFEEGKGSREEGRGTLMTFNFAEMARYAPANVALALVVEY